MSRRRRTLPPFVLFFLLVAVGGLAPTSVASGGEPAAQASAATASAATASAAAAEPAASTVRMIQRLRELEAEQVPDTGWNSVLALEALHRQPAPVEPAERAAYELEVATQMLLSGDAAGAVGKLDALAATPAGQALGNRLDATRAVAWLRLGELENCLDQHTSASCLMPIQGAGVHRRTRGSRRAAELFAVVLERDPTDLTSRWLLNLAYQTLGEYPDGVPPQWLIPPAVFASEAEVGRFEDVAPRVGVAVSGHAGGGVMEDFDGDGRLDLMVSSWRVEDPIHYFRNTGDGFEERTEAAGLAGLNGGLNMVQADYDNDGDRDVLVLRGAWRGRFGRYPNSLLRNEGDGTFRDVTEEAGLLSFHPTQTAGWADYDLDGDLDLFIGNESQPGDLQPSELYRNRGDGTFEEVGQAAGAAVVGFIKGMAWGDYDGDHRPDLYVSRLGQPNVLLRNEAPPPRAGAGEDAGEDAGEAAAPGARFRDVTAEAGVAAPLFGFPTWFFDYDGDGDLDLFADAFGPRQAPAEMPVMKPSIFRRFAAMGVADYLRLPGPGDTPRLYRNRGDGTFEDVTAAAGLDRVIFAMGANYGDLDGDGRPDLYLGTGDPSMESLLPNRALLNSADGRFRDVTTAAGLGHVQKGHAVSFGDVDNDGDQDVHEVMGGAFEGDVYPNALFLNPGTGHPSVTLELEGTASSRDAVGARVRVEVTTADGGERSIYDRVTSGGSFGASPLRRTVGLGDAVAVRSVEVTWPTGETERFTGVEAGGAYRLREGDGVARRFELPVVVLRGEMPAADPGAEMHHAPGPR